MTSRSKTLLVAAGVGAGLIAGETVRRLRKHDLRRKVVLITGASHGLGVALAREFAAEGSKIAICDQDESALRGAVSQLGSAGVSVLAAICDVTDEAAVGRLVETVGSSLGPVHVLINNGAAIRVPTLDTIRAADFEAAMKVTLWGMIYPTVAVLPDMLDRGSGRILNIAPFSPKGGFADSLPYTCAMFAAAGFSDALRSGLSRRGIAVSSIAPGLPGGTTSLLSMGDEAAAQEILRIAKVRDVEGFLPRTARLMSPALSLAAQTLLPAESGSGSPFRGALLGLLSGPWLQLALMVGRLAAKRLEAA